MPAAPAASMAASSWVPFRSRGREGGRGMVCAEMRNVCSAYTLKEELGSGRYGVTRVAECLKTGQRYACKTVSKAVLKTRSDVEDIRREHAILQAIRGHPQVPALEATFEDERAVHFVMELCGGGELFERIQQRKRYGEREAALVLRSVLQLVMHCHRQGIVHREIKPENILLTSACSDTDVKLIDFGVAALLSSPDQVLHEPVGSSFYIAPEVLDGEYGFPADVWSAGIVLYVLLLGGPPFWAPTDDGIVAAIRGDKLRFSRRVPLSDSAKDLVQRMLTRDPRRRISPKEALGHPWIVNMCQPSIMRDVQAEKHGSPSIDRSASVV